MLSNNIINRWNITYLILFIGVVSILSIKGVIYANDSTVYINNGIKVLPLYPLLIDFFEYLFTQNGMSLLILFQIIFALSSIYFFIYVMDKMYKVDYFFKILIMIIMLIPILKNGNYILSEIVSYGLALFFLTYIIKAINEKSLNYLTYIILFSMLIIRPQFKLILIFLCIFAVLQWGFLNKSYKKLVFTLVATVVVYLSSQFFVSFYNSYYNGMKSYIKFEGTNYITTQLYVSDKNSYKVIKENDLRESLKKVLEKIDEEKVSFKYVNNRSHFALNMSTLRKHFNDEFNNDYYIKKYGYYDDIKKRVAFQLIWENKIRYIKYIIRNAFTLTALSMVYVIILLLSSLYGMFKSKNVIFQIVFYMALFSLMNNFLIYALSRFQFRYIYYSDFILLAVTIIFLNVLIREFIEKNKVIGNSNE